MSLEPRDKQDLRFACLRALYKRPRIAFEPQQIATFLHRDIPFGFSIADVSDALSYIEELELAELIEDPMGAGSLYFKISVKGQQDYERRLQTT